MLNRPDRLGLLSNVGCAVLSALAVNGMIAVLSPQEMTGEPSVRWEPAPYVVGLVWVGLFAGLGMARWMVLVGRGGSEQSARLVASLILLCLLYPFYTLGLRSAVIGLIGNLATLGFALFIVRQVLPTSKWAATLVSLVVVWLSFASTLIVKQLSL